MFQKATSLLSTRLLLLFALFVLTALRLSPLARHNRRLIPVRPSSQSNCALAINAAALGQF